MLIPPSPLLNFFVAAVMISSGLLVHRGEAPKVLSMLAWGISVIHGPAH
jgi:hypothetical protein